MVTCLSVETILGLELLGKVHGVVDEGEPGRLSATEVGSEAEGEDPVRGAVVDLGQLVADLEQTRVISYYPVTLTGLLCEQTLMELVCSSCQ